ncbi:MAG: hypothetical protein R3D34_03555 [Nitratireductor sp.]
MIMAILGGDDAGGVIWAPVDRGREGSRLWCWEPAAGLYDSKKGQTLPEGVKPMPLLNAEELARGLQCRCRSPIMWRDIGTWWRLQTANPVKVIGEHGILRDRPGFEVDFMTRKSASEEMHMHDRPSVLMPVRGHWRLVFEGGETVLNPGDTASVPAGLSHGGSIHDRRGRLVSRHRY